MATQPSVLITGASTGGAASQLWSAQAERATDF